LKHFKFYPYDSYHEPFAFTAESEEAAPAAFKIQWEEWAAKLMDYPQNKGKSREELKFEPAEQLLEEEHAIREVGDPALKWNPRPVCCEKINEIGEYAFYEGPPIVLSTARRNPETGDYFSLIDPHWRMRKVGFEVDFCPFCGTKLPEVEKMENPPQPLWIGDDDYCGTCDERNRECECNPPWAAYRIKT
jgi:hypothetical protein